MIKKEDVLFIAHISRCKIAEEEVEMMKNNINDVLNYINILNKVNTDDINAINLNHHNKKNIMRLDIVKQQENKHLIFNNAPKLENKLFLVPAMIERT